MQKQRYQANPGRSASAPSPALLTSYIKKACTLEALMQTYSSHESIFNHIHLSAAWNSLGHLVRTADRNWHQKHAAALESLAARTIHIISSESSVRARELANIAHGVAKSGRGNHMGPLMVALARAIEVRLVECNAQELANAAWAFAKAGHSDSKLFSELGEAASHRIDHFNAQELSNTAWAFATAAHSHPQLFQGIARTTENRLGEFNTQGISNLVWAFAKAGHLDIPFFGSMAKLALQRLREFNAQDLANTAWAYAKMGQIHADLFNALAIAVSMHLDKFNTQGLTNTVWAFAKAGHLDANLFTGLAKAIMAQSPDAFNSQDLANTAWAFAKACHVDESLFSSLATSAQKCMRDFNVQDLVNTAWAFAKVGHFDPSLFQAVAQSVIERQLDDWHAPNIANMAWAFAKGGQVDPALFASLARWAENHLSDFSAQDLANIAWAFANAGQVDAQLFGSMASAAERLWEQFSEEELDNAEWAFSRAGQQRIVRLLRQRKSRNSIGAAALTQPKIDLSKCGRILIVGSGIGGAAAALTLQRQGFDVVVLEADASFDARKQGFGLTIQRQDATHAMGLNLSQDDAPSTSHYTFAADGQVLGFFGEAFSKSKDRPESEDSGRFIHIPRQTLRARIVEQLRPGTIAWDSRLQSFECHEHGVTVTLTNGASLDAGLLIGSDGLFSTVRRQMNLRGDHLKYVGLLVVLGIVPTDDGRASVRVEKGKCRTQAKPTVAAPLAQRRIFETVDGTTRIYAMPFTTTTTMWQLSFPYAEDAARMLVKDPRALKEEILRRCAGWHEPIPTLLNRTDLECMSGYPIYDRELLQPHTLREPESTKQMPSQPPRSCRRVTLMGDAAHPMTPFKAQGANQALIDAVLLAETLVENIQKHGPEMGIDIALPLFEKKMLSRSARAVVGSREKAKEMHSSLALQPARKVQRETGIDMRQAIRVLRGKGIGAHSATDPRGLDLVVAQAIENAISPLVSSKVEVTTNQSASSEETSCKGGKRKAIIKERQPIHLLGAPKMKKRKIASVSTAKGQAEVRSSEAKLQTPQTDHPRAEKGSSNGKSSCTSRNGSSKVHHDDTSVKEVGKLGANGLKTRGAQMDVMARRGSSMMAGAKASAAGRLLWGFIDGQWEKCTLTRKTMRGNYKVKWRDGTSSILKADFIQPRLKKKVEAQAA